MQHCLGYSSIVITCHHGFAWMWRELNIIDCSLVQTFLSSGDCSCLPLLLSAAFEPTATTLQDIQSAAICYPWHVFFRVSTPQTSNRNLAQWGITRQILLFAITCHHLPSLAITCHHLPSLAITCHHLPQFLQCSCHVLGGGDSNI